MAFFVGAGISINSGLPNFWAFGKHIIDSVTGRLVVDEEILRGNVLTDAEVISLVNELRPEVLLQALFDEFGERVFDFYDWLECDEPNPNHEFLARAIETGHLVFTPNVTFASCRSRERCGRAVEVVVSLLPFSN